MNIRAFASIFFAFAGAAIVNAAPTITMAGATGDFTGTMSVYGNVTVNFVAAPSGAGGTWQIGSASTDEYFGPLRVGFTCEDGGSPSNAYAQPRVAMYVWDSATGFTSGEFGDGTAFLIGNEIGTTKTLTATGHSDSLWPDPTGYHYGYEWQFSLPITWDGTSGAGSGEWSFYRPLVIAPDGSSTALLLGMAVLVFGAIRRRAA